MIPRDGIAWRVTETNCLEEIPLVLRALCWGKGVRRRMGGLLSAACYEVSGRVCIVFLFEQNRRLQYIKGTAMSTLYIHTPTRLCCSAPYTCVWPWTSDEWKDREVSRFFRSTIIGCSASFPCLPSKTGRHLYRYGTFLLVVIMKIRLG